MFDFLKSRFRSSSSKKPLMMDLRKILLISVMFNYKIIVRISMLIIHIYHLYNYNHITTLKESRSSEMSVVGFPFFEIFCFAAGFSR